MMLHFGKSKKIDFVPDHAAPVIVPKQQLQVIHKPETNITNTVLSAIPDFVVNILFNLLRKVLKEKGGNCMVMYLKSDKEIKKAGLDPHNAGIEKKVDMVILDFDPRTKFNTMQEKLMHEEKLRVELVKRNKFLEHKYKDYLNMLNNNNHGQQGLIEGA